MKVKCFSGLVFFLCLSLSSVAQNLPSPSLVGYWQNWSSLSLNATDSRYNVVVIAFPLPAVGTDYDLSNLDYGPHTYSTFKTAVATLQNQGKKVLLSLGGASAPIYLDNDSEKNTFIVSVGALLDDFSFDGIDIDLESSSLSFTNVKITGNTDVGMLNMIAAIKQILVNYQSTHGKRCLLTMAPEVVYTQGGFGMVNSFAGAFLPIIEALRNDLDLLHVQLYNVGEGVKALDGKTYYEGSADFIIAMTEMMIKGFTAYKLSGTYGVFAGLPANKVAIGLPACASSASGYVDAATRKQAIDYLTGTGSRPGAYVLLNKGGYPNLGGLMTWSINNDKSCNPSYGIASTFQNSFSSYNAVIEMQENNFVVYPNPTQNEIYVNLNFDNSDSQYRLINSLGEIVIQENITSKSFKVDMNTLSVGIYFLQVGTQVQRIAKF